MKITLLFGAGASYGSGACHPHTPPLGNNLFTELEKHGKAFSNLSAHNKKIFIDHGFELGMASLPNDSRILNPLQKEIALYLSKFTIKPENAYVRFFSKLKLLLPSITIATLNYDILIEQALGYIGIPTDYNFPPKNNHINILKPHGSSNFLLDIDQCPRVSGLTLIDCQSFYDGFPTKAVQSHDEVKAWCSDIRSSDFSPVLALYEKGKRVVVNNTLIKEIQDNYANAISSSDLVVLVGVKYIEHDEHIWKPLENNKTNLIIVDPHPNDTISWVRKNQFKDITLIEKGFNESVIPLSRKIKLHALTNS